MTESGRNYREPIPSFSFLYGGIPFDKLEKTVDVREDSVTYTLPDGLQVKTCIVRYPASGVVRWTNYFTNLSENPTEIISELWDCDLTVPFEPDPIPTRRDGQHTMNPRTLQIFETIGANVQADDYRPNPVRIWENSAPYKTSCICGRSGMGREPYFDINRGEKGVLAALGWTGQWEFSVARTHDAVRITGGIQNVNFRILPGESFRTASAAVLFYDEGQDNAHNRWRSFMREISPLRDGTRGSDCPFSAIFWGGIPSQDLMERWDGIFARKLPFDTCWIDAGWYEPLSVKTAAEQLRDWPQVGTWNVSKAYHPEGYRDVSAYLHSHGVRFMVWFEPERVRLNLTDRVKTLRCPEEELNGLVALNEESVLEDTCRYIGDRIEQMGVDIYRQDCNINLMNYWKANEEGGDRQGILQIHYINNLYRFWDYLLDRFPRLLIDNCAGGGHRNDFEMLSRSVPLWRSDYQCTWNCLPEANQIQNQSAAWWIPYAGIGYGPDLGDTYSFRSAYCNGMTVRTWEHADPEWKVGATDEPFDWARKYFEEYRSLRRYFALDFYPLTPVSLESGTWSCCQYHDPDTDTGILLGFRREKSPAPSILVNLGGLRDEALYELENLDTGEKFVLRGSRMKKDGVLLTIAEKRASHIWKYRAVSET